MNTRLLLALAFVGLVTYSAIGQYRPSSSSGSGKGSLMDKFYFGAGVSAYGGSGPYGSYFYAAALPMVGYKLIGQFSAGIQTNLQYFTTGGYNYFDKGGGPFMVYKVTSNLFGWAQYEFINRKDAADRSVNFRSTFLGIGYSSPLSSDISANIIGMYDVSYGTGAHSLYDIPIQLRVLFIKNF